MSPRWSMAITAIWLGACGFELDTLAPTDAPPDVVDVPPVLPPRSRVGLVGFWTFDDPAGTTFAADTSGAMPPIPLEVITQGGIPAPAFASGTVTAVIPVRMITPTNTRLAADCATANAVTLEVWVRAGASSQGSMTEPAFITGLAGSVDLRDIALMQAGNRWLGQVRTNGSLKGAPELVSQVTASITGMTHIVLVADASQRILYVNNLAEAVTPPGAPTGWDLGYAMTLFDEYQHARPWVGAVAMVALYKRALPPAEVTQHFMLGPDAP